MPNNWCKCPPICCKQNNKKNGWTNSRVAGDLRHKDVHNDVTVMWYIYVWIPVESFDCLYILLICVSVCTFLGNEIMYHHHTGAQSSNAFQLLHFKTGPHVNNPSNGCHVKYTPLPKRALQHIKTRHTIIQATVSIFNESLLLLKCPDGA